MRGWTGCFSKWFLTDFLHCFHVGNLQESGSRYESQGHWWDPRTWPQSYMAERQVTPSNKISESLQILNVLLKDPDMRVRVTGGTPEHGLSPIRLRDR